VACHGLKYCVDCDEQCAAAVLAPANAALQVQGEIEEAARLREHNKRGVKRALQVRTLCLSRVFCSCQEKCALHVPAIRFVEV